MKNAEKLSSKSCAVLPSEKYAFAKGVERLVNPISVGSLHFIEQFNELLPKKVQKYLVNSSSKTIPHMGFVVEPYSSFLFYEIKDLEKAKLLIPDGFEIVKTSIFTDDEPKYYCIYGCFRAHTSAFWGVRTEFYIIAEDKKTGLLSWIIVDYDTNTISYDNKHGLSGPNASKSVMTINHRGTLYVDMVRDDESRELTYELNVGKGNMKDIDQRLWLEGNLSVGYGKKLSETGADIFSLKFEPCEVEKALEIPLSALKLEKNNWYDGLYQDEPTKVVCFPYAQHFVSDSPGTNSNIKDEAELVRAINALDFEHMETFSAKSFKKMFLLGMMASFFTTVILIILLILK